MIQTDNKLDLSDVMMAVLLKGEESLDIKFAK
jgi:hypothetical protein